MHASQRKNARLIIEESHNLFLCSCFVSSPEDNFELPVMLPTALITFGGTILIGRTLARRNAKSSTKEPSASRGNDAVGSLPTAAQTLKLIETRR